MTTLIKPNIPLTDAATDNPAVPTLGSIAEKMAVMREQTVRNQIRATEDAATGQEESKAEASSPVAPEVPEDSNIDDVDLDADRKSTRLNSSHIPLSRMPSSA